MCVVCLVCVEDREPGGSVLGVWCVRCVCVCMMRKVRKDASVWWLRVGGGWVGVAYDKWLRWVGGYREGGIGGGGGGAGA